MDESLLEDWYDIEWGDIITNTPWLFEQHQFGDRETQVFWAQVLPQGDDRAIKLKTEEMYNVQFIPNKAEMEQEA